MPLWVRSSRSRPIGGFEILDAVLRTTHEQKGRCDITLPRLSSLRILEVTVRTRSSPEWVDTGSKGSP
jgi:hypothetical protein